MATEQLQDVQLVDRPETSKFSRVSRRHNRTKTQMRSTSNNWADHDRNNPSPFLKRKLTLEKRKGPLSPKPILRPTSQEKPFRAGITLQQYFIDHPVRQIENTQDPEGEEETLFPQEFNFKIEERQDDDEQQSFSKSRQMQRPSRRNLQVVEQPQQDKNFSIRNVSNLWKHKQPPKLPDYPSNLQDRKRKTTFEFYKPKQPKSNLQEFQATEQYLMKKYANKFQLNDLGQDKRIQKAINRSQKQPLLGTRTKII